MIQPTNIAPWSSVSANSLGVTSLRYQKLEHMISAIGVPRDKVCTFCWNGCE